MDSYSQVIYDAVEAAKKSVVKIERLLPVNNKKTVKGSGSGFFFSSDGYLFTNSHVVHAAPELRVVLYDGSRHLATLIGEDQDTDLAILKVDGALDFQPAQLGDIGPADPAALEIDDLAVVAPDEIEIVRLVIRERLDEDFRNDREHDGEGAEADDERGDHGEREHRRAHEAPHGELRIPAPVPRAPPRRGGAEPLAQAIADRIEKRAHPDSCEREVAALQMGGTTAIEVRLDE